MSRDGAEAEIVQIEQAVRARTNAHLRIDAAVAYISDPACDSLEKLAANEKFKGKVSLRTLERWCSEDKWVRRRQEFLRSVYAEMRKRAHDELTQALIRDVNMLIEVRGHAFELLRDPTVQPRSYEGLLRSFVDLSRRIEEVARQGADRLIPGGMQDDEEGSADRQDGPDELPEGLSAEEIDAMTSAALAARRRALTAGTPPDSEPEPNPDPDPEGPELL